MKYLANNITLITTILHMEKVDIYTKIQILKNSKEKGPN